jgi:hypothetical protein
VPTTLQFVKPDGTYATVTRAATPQRMTALAIDRANGHQPVWAEATDMGTHVENTALYTAPYATSESTVQRQKVAVLDDKIGAGGYRMVAHRGVALNITAGSTALLTRLSDGKG